MVALAWCRALLRLRDGNDSECDADRLDGAHLRPAPDYIVDVVELYGKPMARIQGRIIEWVLFGHLDPLYRVKIYLKPWSKIRE